MDLDEFIWREKTSNKELAEIALCAPTTILNMKKRRKSPGLLLALKIAKIGDGKIQLEDLLSEEDLKKYEEWLKR